MEKESTPRLVGEIRELPLNQRTPPSKKPRNRMATNDCESRGVAGAEVYESQAVGDTGDLVDIGFGEPTNYHSLAAWLDFKFQPLNHKKQKCKMRPNNHHGKSTHFLGP